jgi:outer membrane receptor protein involved in Fe transport
VYDDKTTKNEAAAFARLSRKLGKTRLFLDQQLRSVSLSFTPDPNFVPPTENIPVRNWLFFNPKLGMQHELSLLIDLYATAGYTQREPTRFDILNGGVNVDQSNLFLVQDVHAVKPESVFDVEAGVKLKGEKLSGQANFFNMEFRNEIQAIGGFSQFVPIRKNIERSFRRGLELDLAYKINQQVSIFGNLTLMQTGIKEYRQFVEANLNEFGKDTSLVFNNVQAVLSPKLLGRLGVQVTLFKGLDVSLSSRHVGEQFVELTNNADFVLPSFTLLDAQLSYRLWKNHSFLLMVNNLTNQRYYTFGTGDPLVDRRPNVFVQAPLNIMAMLKLQF